MHLFNFESDDNKLWCFLILGLATFGVSAVVGTNWYYAAVDTAAIKAGYSRQTLPGVSGTHWVKDGVTR